MSTPEQPPMRITVTYREDGDVDVASEEGMNFPDIIFLLNLAQYKMNLSYFGMVLRAQEIRRQEEAKSKPNILIPR